MAKKPKIKRPASTGRENVSRGNPRSTGDSLHPVFCLKHMVSGFSIDECNKDEKAQILDALSKRSKCSWGTIKAAHRHGIGTETIARASIRASIPAVLTEDTAIIAMRCIGMAPMVGYRDGPVFHIVWIDREYKLYKH